MCLLPSPDDIFMVEPGQELNLPGDLTVQFPTLGIQQDSLDGIDVVI